MLTNTQDEALCLLARVIRSGRGPVTDAAYLLIDAVRRGDAAEQAECTEGLRKAAGIPLRPPT